MRDRLPRSRIILGSVAGVFVTATVVLAFFVFRLHRDLRSNYAVDMRLVSSDLTLADNSLNQHEKVNGSPDYLVSEAAATLFQIGSPYAKGNAVQIANALSSTEYIITHPSKRTSEQYASAKAFVRSAAQELKSSVAMNGSSINVRKVQLGLKKLSDKIPPTIKNFH